MVLSNEMGAAAGSQSMRRNPRLPFAAWRGWRHVMFVVAAIGVGGCLPTVTTLAVEGAYTASEERTTDDVVVDNRIKLALNKALLDEGFELFKDVSTVVYQGRVLLIGAVEKADARKRAGELAAKPRGVREVINEIKVTDEGGVGAFVNDTVLEKKIQLKYLFDKEVDSANFRVRSVNGVVYLIGLAQSQAELDRALSILRENEDVRAVVNYVRVKKPGG